MLQDKLFQLETRLQALIEGNAARIFPQREIYHDLASLLLAAMKDNLQTKSDGKIYAPNLFTLQTDQDDAAVFRENHTMLAELASVIQQAGEESGLDFYSPPIIRVATAVKASPHQVRIQAQFSHQQLGKTATLTTQTDDQAESMPSNAFLIVNGKDMFPLTHAVINIGRRPDNHLCVDDRRVSRIHAQMRAKHGRFIIFDLDSTGGTFVNGKRIKQYTLHPGDVISLAGALLIFGQDTASFTNGDQDSTHPIMPYPQEE